MVGQAPTLPLQGISNDEVKVRTEIMVCSAHAISFILNFAPHKKTEGMFLKCLADFDHLIGSKDALGLYFWSFQPEYC